MILLSKYSVFEYLNWLKNNNFLINERTKEFNDVLADIENCNVFDVESGTKNIVFEVNSSTPNRLIFKQFGVNLEEKKQNFTSEVEALKLDFAFSPKLHFQDFFNQIIFIQKFNDYSPISKILKSLKKSEIEEIKNLLKNVVEKIKVIHAINTFNTSQKYPLEKWETYIKERYPISNLLSSFQEIWNSKSCLIHHDLNGANILVKDNDLKIIDWEMAELGHPYFDLCSIIRVICMSLSDSHFFEFEITNTSRPNFSKVKECVDFFLTEFDNHKREDLIIIMKIHSYDLYNDDFYFQNIERVISLP